MDTGSDSHSLALIGSAPYGLCQSSPAHAFSRPLHGGRTEYFLEDGGLWQRSWAFEQSAQFVPRLFNSVTCRPAGSIFPATESARAFGEFVQGVQQALGGLTNGRKGERLGAVPCGKLAAGGVFAVAHGPLFR